MSFLHKSIHFAKNKQRIVLEEMVKIKVKMEKNQFLNPLKKGVNIK